MSAPDAPNLHGGFPPGRPMTLWLSSLGVLALLWMPLTLLRQLDAFLAFYRPAELARDVALATLVLALAALLGTLLAVGMARLVPQRHRPAVAWAIALGPPLWVCIWQFASSAWAWFRLVSGTALTPSPALRVAVALCLVVLLVIAARRGLLGAATRRLIPTLQSLRMPAVAMLAMAVAVLAWQPPRGLWGAEAAHAVTPAAGAPDVLLITLDTVAAADAAVCGDGPTRMPQLRAFAQQATCFERHYASSNFTTPSTSTMETGALPWSHWGVQIVASMAPDWQRRTLAAQLRERGYTAFSLSANIMASPRHHGSASTYDRHEIADSTSLGLIPRQALTVFGNTTLPYWLAGLVPFLDTADVYLHGERSPFAPEYAYDGALRWLQAQGQPAFLWVHTLPPHDPYLPPRSTKYKLLPPGPVERWSQMLAMGQYGTAQQRLVDQHRLRYQEALLGADESLGRFLDELQRQGRLDKALVIITSDHGESFERGYLGHAGEPVHEAVVRVPLVIKLPGQRAGRVVSTPVSLADIVPTVSDVLGLPAIAGRDGRSLKPALLGDELPPQPVFTMAMERQSRFRPIRAGHYAVIDGSFKLVLHAAEQRAELYDLAEDPHEQRDVSAQRPDVAQRLRALLDARLADAERRRAAQFGG